MKLITINRYILTYKTYVLGAFANSCDPVKDQQTELRTCPGSKPFDTLMADDNKNTKN